MKSERLARDGVGPGSPTRLPGREADALIDEKLFGFEVEWCMLDGRETPYRKGHQDFGMPATVPLYHEDMGEAWRIVEEFRRRGLRLSIDAYEDLVPGKKYCQALLDHKDERYEVSGWDAAMQMPDERAYGTTGQWAIVKKALMILEADSQKA